ncbi:NAD(P)-dependent oxidoreductase [Sphingobacterium sp. SRCM116780]|uniref:NAD-dependent epimerase/dehydratase family protein n=1 Tax=Sphingobacterium sp. SRCM116780 TaxID=2907623 RepID=UPI001F44064C|nr:NAD(P)-dependent oxidoreductase [Sphingobacterium sp. SRCM116780]UIR56387.1 NAD(P)-dependent oxidoreductase [Sphingobacterium sp. SRCM116780]
MNKKILITGASGFVGYHLVQAAHEAGLEVHAAVRKTSDVSEIKAFVNKFVYPNFKDKESLIELLEQEQYAYIVHAAAMTRAKNEKDLIDVNVGYTEHLAGAIREANIPLERFVFISSLAAVGPVAYDAPAINERNKFHPVTAYGRSKVLAEQMLEKQQNDKLSIIRPTAVYGPREKDLFVLFKTLNSGFDAYIGKSPQKLTFVFVKDLVDAILNACFFDTGKMTAYNITDGLVYDRYDMAAIFKKYTAKSLFRFHIPFTIVKGVARVMELAYKKSKAIPVLYPERLNELTAASWACDISASKENIQYNPKYDLDTGLKITLQWYRDHKWL